VLIARLSAGVILHTETQANLLKKYGPRNVRCVYLGIRTRPIQRERKTLHRALFFGKITPIKGIHLFPGIARACPDIQFIVACSSEEKYEEYRRELVRDFAGIPNLEFICKEWIGDEEKESLFMAADVLVLPYVNGFFQSGAASESGVYNIPIVVTRLGPITEIPNKFGNGVTIPDTDPETVKRAIQTVFENYPDYLAGIQRYRDAANWTEAAKNYVNYLRG
jgi:glycosyltransferase involved in cell wall biosynthesis